MDDIVDIFVESLEENSNFISKWLDKKLLWALNSSNNSLNLVLDNQSLIFNISWESMYLYEINAHWVWTQLILQIIRKALNDWLRYIHLEAKPLFIDSTADLEYEKVEKYLFSFWFERKWETNHFTLDLDNSDILKVLNNKFKIYIQTNNWIKL